ncbi:MAG: NrsF family protein [Alphaproteobacteria bacterium]
MYKTSSNYDQFILKLVAKAPVRDRFTARLPVLIALGVFVMAGIFAFLFQIRLDFLNFFYDAPIHSLNWQIGFKFILPILLLPMALFGLLKLGSPYGFKFKKSHIRYFGLIALIMICALLADIILSLFIKTNTHTHSVFALAPYGCVLSITGLATPMLFLILAAMRAGTPVQPVLSGIFAGAVAFSFAAMIYALHCPNDSMLHIVLWYGLAFVATTSLGGLLGHKLLRW